MWRRCWKASSRATSRLLALTRAVHGEAGALSLYGNYGGDAMNFDLAPKAVEGRDRLTAADLALSLEAVIRGIRARWFTERSRGEIHPGAVSGSLIVRTVVQYVIEEGPP